MTIGLSSAQEKISFQFTQDARLAFVGDGNSYDAGTLDMTFSVILQGHQQKCYPGATACDNGSVRLSQLGDKKGYRTSQDSQPYQK